MYTKEEFVGLEEKALKRLAISSLVFMVIIIFLSISIVKYENVPTYANTVEEIQELEEKEEESENDDLFEVEQHYKEEPLKAVIKSSQNIKKRLGDTYIQIAKGEKIKTVSVLEDLYMQKKIRIRISGLSEKSIVPDSIMRMSQGELFEGSPILKVVEKTIKKKKKIQVIQEIEPTGDVVQTMDIVYEWMEKDSFYNVDIELGLDHIYAYELFEDKEYLYINLVDLHEVYDKILVIDIGHGGSDDGTDSFRDVIKEKDMNLKIGLYLKELLEKEEIKVYYTRLTDEKVYLNPRVNLANEVRANFFLSIHCNSSTLTQPYGTEVLYSTSPTDSVISSQRLAGICQNELINILGTRDRGIIKRNDIYILKKSKVPAALYELVFISNPEDLEFIMKEENQKKMAQGIYNGIIKSYELLK